MMENNIEKIGNWFVEQLSLYQNANNDNASVKKNFIVRVSEFELIVSDLLRKKSQDPLQHELLLGRRGSGKSTLLRRIQIEIEENTTLNEKYIAVNLAEEQAGIYRLSDLWYEVLKEIAVQTNKTVELQAFSTFKNNQEYARYLYGEIHKILVEQQKKAVLLLDNLDRIIENFDDDGHLLRETLLNYNDLQIIGGSTRMDEHFWQYDKPFYEFFRRHRLEGLTFEEIHQLLNQWSKALDLPQLKDYALKNKGKIEALRILTDGLPRTLQFFIKIFLKNSTLTGFDHIKQTMDLASPLYQERLNSLTAPQRKIVLEMAFIWEACSTKQLIDVCRMEGKLISSFMKQLNSFGIVETLQTNTKNHLYRLSERFFNMWLIVTQGNPDQKRKARYLTIFLETWYDADEIRDMANTHYQNLKGKKMGYDQAVVLTKAISQSKYIGVAERDELLDLTTQLDDCDTNKGDLPEQYAVIFKRIDKLKIDGNYQEALKEVEQIENENDGIKFFLKAYFSEELGYIDKAEKYYLQSEEKGNITSVFNLGCMYQKQNKFRKAEEYYLKAIKGKHIYALQNLAVLYHNEGRIEDAKKYYLQGIEKGIIEVYPNLADLYFNQNKFEEAENYFLKSIKNNFISNDGLKKLAFLYQSQGNYEDAEKCYLQAIDNGDISSLNSLGLIYYSQEKNKEAEKYFLKALENGELSTLNNLGMLYSNQGEIKKAEQYYLRAIDSEDEEGINRVAKHNLANLYYRINQKKNEAYNLIQDYRLNNPLHDSTDIQILINIWNGVFENLESKINLFFKESEKEDLTWFIENLLYQEQTHLVQSLFEDQGLGQDLMDKYQLLYYATLILNNKTDNNLLLRIPPDVMPTVEKIVAEVKEKQAFYAEG